MATLKLTCCVCGHVWDPIDRDEVREFEPAKRDEAKKTMQAAKSNKQGPYCGLCRHFEMAERFALHRGFATAEAALREWRRWSQR